MFAFFVLPPLLTAIVSLVYFMASPKGTSKITRLFASLHGLSIALIYVYGTTLIFTRPTHARDVLGRVFEVSLIVPIILAGVSFELFDGPDAIHLLQVINALVLVWMIWFIPMSMAFA